MVGEVGPPTPLGSLPGHVDLDLFACGEPALDDWLKERARLAEGRSARTYVLPAAGRVAGYHCLSTGSLERAQLPRRLRHGNPDPVPVFVLGRLAVDRPFQGRGLGRDMIVHAFRQCLAAGAIVGARALVVHPLGEHLLPFYTGLGFLPLPGHPEAMLMPLETIADAFA